MFKQFGDYREKFYTSDKWDHTIVRCDLLKTSVADYVVASRDRLSIIRRELGITPGRNDYFSIESEPGALDCNILQAKRSSAPMWKTKQASASRRSDEI